MSGAEVSTMLIRTGSATERFYQHARDRVEACSIGQELLNCGLLVAVCWGIDGEMDVNDDQVDATDANDDDDASVAMSMSMSMAANDANSAAAGAMSMRDPGVSVSVSGASVGPGMLLLGDGESPESFNGPKFSGE